MQFRVFGRTGIQPAMGPEARTRDDVLRLLIGLDRVADMLRRRTAAVAELPANAATVR